MKKRINFLLFLVSFICTTVHAQLQKGTLFLSENSPEVNLGAIGLNSGSLGNLNFLDGLTIYSASPSLGYFVSDRLMLEGSLFLTGIRNDGEGVNIYGAGAGGRFYINPKNPKNNFFVEAQYNFFGISIDGESARQSSYGAGIGSTWFLAPGVSFDTRLLFAGPFSNDNLLSTTEVLSLGTGLNFYLNPTMKSGRKTVVPALQKGKWMIGSSSGDINLSFDPNNFSLSLLPSIGYFVTDQFVTGAKVGINFERTEDFTGGTTTSTLLSFAPLARYYVGENTRLRWFMGGSLGLAYAAIKSDFGDVDDTTFNINVNGGLNLFLTPNFALEVGPFLATDFDGLFGGLNVGFNYFVR